MVSYKGQIQQSASELFSSAFNRACPTPHRRMSTSPRIQSVCDFLDQFAPARLAEDWDNVGLLAGDRQAPCKRVMTCLTITPESAAEAIVEQADLIVSHHPLPFKPLRQLTTDQTTSRLLWNLAGSQVAIYSPHTGFDSAQGGINQQLAERLRLTSIQPLQPFPDDAEGLGAGRWGQFNPSAPLQELLVAIKTEFEVDTFKFVGAPSHSVTRVAVACGSGGSFLEQAIRAGCDTFVTGEATFHTCLEARAHDVGMILMGHYNSERFAVEALARQIQNAFPELDVWASRKEDDPVSFA